MLTRESCRLALAESQSILRAQEIERVAKETEAIGRIRAQRIANKANRFRRNSISVAACLSCCAAGFLIAVFFKNTSSTPIPKIEAQTKNSQWIGKVLDASSQSIAPIVISSSPLPQTAKTITTAPIQVVKVDPLPAPQPTQAVTRITAVTEAGVAASISQSKKSPQSKSAIDRTVAPAKRVEPFKKIVIPEEISKKVQDKGNDDAEVVLPSRLVKQEPVDSKFQEKTQTTSQRYFKVVNAIEGALIIQEGQTVKQFKIGDKLPNGKILSSVDPENLKFEVDP